MKMLALTSGPSQGGFMDATYFHLAMNHFPVIGAVFAMVILAWGIFRDSEEIKNLGFAAMIVTAMVAIPVFLTGEPAEETVEGLPGVLESVIEQHEDFAKFALIASIVSGVAAFAAFMHGRIRSTHSVVGRSIAIVTLALSIATVGAMSWTAKLGGVIRHTEIGATTPGQSQPADAKKADRHKDDDDE
jgi:hypothetical protein